MGIKVSSEAYVDLGLALLDLGLSAETVVLSLACMNSGPSATNLGV